MDFKPQASRPSGVKNVIKRSVTFVLNETLKVTSSNDRNSLVIMSNHKRTLFLLECNIKAVILTDRERVKLKTVRLFCSCLYCPNVTQKTVRLFCSCLYCPNVTQRIDNINLTPARAYPPARAQSSKPRGFTFLNIRGFRSDFASVRYFFPKRLS